MQLQASATVLLFVQLHLPDSLGFVYYTVAAFSTLGTTYSMQRQLWNLFQI